jgi:hypothetical protein
VVAEGFLQYLEIFGFQHPVVLVQFLEIRVHAPLPDFVAYRGALPLALVSDQS